MSRTCRAYVAYDALGAIARFEKALSREVQEIAQKNSDHEREFCRTESAVWLATVVQVMRGAGHQVPWMGVGSWLVGAF